MLKNTSGFVRRACAAWMALALCAYAQSEWPKIGFLVKMPEQGRFINEQKAAARAGREIGFDVINLGVQDGEKVLSAIDNLAAQGAQGFVICAPDVRLGPAIMARAQTLNLKFVTVDDQLQGADGTILAAVPHLGMSASKIGWAIRRPRRAWSWALSRPACSAACRCPAE